METIPLEVKVMFSKIFTFIIGLPTGTFVFIEKGLDFKGRENRFSFWQGYFGLVILTISILSLFLGLGRTLSTILLILSLMTFFCLVISAGVARRLRDAGYTPWLAITPLAPPILIYICMPLGLLNATVIYGISALFNILIFLNLFLCCQKSGE